MGELPGRSGNTSPAGYGQAAQDQQLAEVERTEGIESARETTHQLLDGYLRARIGSTGVWAGQISNAVANRFFTAMFFSVT